MTAGTKPGDWFCPSCNDLQFAKNTQCRKCGTPNPDPLGSMNAMAEGMANRTSSANEKPGDWYCPACGDLQFARNAQCRKCGTPNPDPQSCIELATAAGHYREGGGAGNNPQKSPETGTAATVATSSSQRTPTAGNVAHLEAAWEASVQRKVVERVPKAVILEEEEAAWEASVQRKVVERA